MKYRIEHDTLGEVRVPDDSLWGAQTQRSLNNFRIGDQLMPIEIIYALAAIKKAAATVNDLSDEKKKAIADACDRIMSGEFDDQFPLSVWQTGSGTQTNMNVNEVIAHIAGAGLHPNDDVNKSQSTNDTFPSAIHIASTILIEDELLPAMGKMMDVLSKLEEKFGEVVKVGRTHLQDAVPLTLGQEFSSWKDAVEKAFLRIEKSCEEIKKLPLGGTAVGTGLNTPKDYDKHVCEELSGILHREFKPCDNKFTGLAFKDSISAVHSDIRVFAEVMMKIADDVRWYASGPRCGIGELIIPANEPGSSIMPGKVNPTQCEAMTMVCARIIGNDVTMSTAASRGNFQLNVFMPVIGYVMVESIRTLADAVCSFTDNCLGGIDINREAIDGNLDKSLMNITALNKVIGYEKSAEIAKLAYSKGIRLLDACLELGYLSEEEFNRYVDPKKMV